MVGKIHIMVQEEMMKNQCHNSNRKMTGKEAIKQFMFKRNRGANMGWTNYIIVPKWNVKFQVDRSVDFDTYNQIKAGFNRILEYATRVEETLLDPLDKPLMDITVDDITNILLLAKGATNIFYDYSITSYMLMMYLDSIEVNFEIASEYKLTKEQEEMTILW